MTTSSERIDGDDTYHIASLADDVIETIEIWQRAQEGQHRTTLALLKDVPSRQHSTIIIETYRKYQEEVHRMVMDELKRLRQEIAAEVAKLKPGRS